MTVKTTLLHTHRERAPALWATRQLVARLLPALEWRWHGIGLLQAYVCEGERELRVHVWAPRLMLDGIATSGNAHNHRFRLRSTVLTGVLRHTEWHLSPDSRGDHDLWDFPHARLQTEETRASMRQLGQPCSVFKLPALIGAGEVYEFERGAYHSSEPLTDVVVTLVEKLDQVEESARVVAPLHTPPVPAFGGDDLDERDPTALLERAAFLLRAGGAG
jgi:hypothetical protein